MFLSVLATLLCKIALEQADAVHVLRVLDAEEVQLVEKILIVR